MSAYDFKRDPLWFFVWANGQPRPYPTSIAGYDRSTVIEDAEKLIGRTWKQIYREGGRCVRCYLVPVEKEAP